MARETSTVPVNPGRLCTFRWLAAFGDQPDSKGTYSLRVNGKDVLSFDASLTDKTWQGKDARSTLKYIAEQVKDGVSSGLMELTIPSSLLKPAQPVELCVYISARGHHRWFGVYELDKQG